MELDVAGAPEGSDTFGAPDGSDTEVELDEAGLAAGVDDGLAAGLAGHFPP